MTDVRPAIIEVSLWQSASEVEVQSLIDQSIGRVDASVSFAFGSETPEGRTCHFSVLEEQGSSNILALTQWLLTFDFVRWVRIERMGERARDQLDT